MGIVRKINRLLYGGRWDIAFRCKGSDDRYTICKLPRREFCADPFLIEVDGKEYLFCEQYRIDKRKGCIGFFEFINGTPVNKGIVLEKPYHLSYPCVFRYKDAIYMIPESSENRTVELYKAIDFPSKWRLESVLLSGDSYVDTTVVVNDENIHFVTYHRTDDDYALDKYVLSEDLHSAIKITEKHYQTNTGRGAGAFYIDTDGNMIRPSQDCTNSYGESLILNRVISDFDIYEEEPIGVLKKSDVHISEAKNIIGVHTLASNEKYDVIDFFSRRVDLTYTIGNLIAKRIRKRKLKK